MIANTGQHDIVDNFIIITSIIIIILVVMALGWRFHNYALTFVGGVSLKDSAAL